MRSGKRQKRGKMKIFFTTLGEPPRFGKRPDFLRFFVPFPKRDIKKGCLMPSENVENTRPAAALVSTVD